MFGKLVTVNLDKRDDVIHLEPIGDPHFGHIGFQEDLYKERIRDIMKRDNRYTVFMGDQVDFINPLDKRWQAGSVTILSKDDQRKYWQRVNQPLIDLNNKLKEKGRNEKIWGLLAGNHEYKVIDQSYIINQFCEPNKLDYLGSKAMVGLVVKHKGKTIRRWKLFIQHGSGGGSNPLTALDQMKVNHIADVYLMGHLHNKLYKGERVVDFNFSEGGVVYRDIGLGNTGTFCETYTDKVDGYMDRKNKVTPSKLGTITISFDAYQGKIHGHE